MSTKKTDLQQKLNELETLIAWFEDDDVQIEQAIEKFERGSQLASEIRTQLMELENKITILEKRFDEEA